jgi:hypothetical protein
MKRGFSNLFKAQNWRSGWAFVNALRAYHKGDYQAALGRFDQVLTVDLLRTAEYMNFYATLLTLNKRRPEALRVYEDLIAGKFRPSRTNSKYAEAYAHYWLAYLTNRQDVVARWLDAYKLKPRRGFASDYLPLPDSPLLK